MSKGNLDVNRGVANGKLNTGIERVGVYGMSVTGGF